MHLHRDGGVYPDMIWHLQVRRAERDRRGYQLAVQGTVVAGCRPAAGCRCRGAMSDLTNIVVYYPSRWRSALDRFAYTMYLKSDPAITLVVLGSVPPDYLLGAFINSGTAVLLTAEPPWTSDGQWALEIDASFVHRPMRQLPG